jgi:hypothetical protein
MTGPPGTQPAPAAPADRRWRLRHLPAALAVSAALLVAAAVAGWLAAGATGALGAAAGVALVTVGYLLSTLVVAWADSVATPLVMPIGMMAYLVKLTVIGGVMFIAAFAGWRGLIPMAWGVVAGVLGWTAGTIWRAVRR